MAQLIPRHRPPQIAAVSPDEYFDVLVTAIVGQQLSVRAADTIEQRLRNLLGALTPENVLIGNNDALRAVGLSRSKILYIKTLAAAFSNGQINPPDLQYLSDDEVLSRLVAVKGIGPWTAEMFLIFGLGRLDVWSAGDLGLRRTLEHFFDSSDPTIADRWRPYRSVAAWYLWEHSDQLMGRHQQLG